MPSRLLAHASVATSLFLVVLSCNKTSPTEPTPVCSYTLAPVHAEIPTEGGSASVTVTAPAGCTWTAAASAGWIAITAGTSGSGPGTVSYAVEANGATDSRSGAVTVAGQSHTIVQHGRVPTACSYDLTPGSATFTNDGGSGTFSVTAPGECRWTASSSAPWLVITSGGQQAGTGTVAYTVSRQTESAERSATIAVADRRFGVRQSGDVSLCRYSVTPVTFTPCMAGGALTAAIATQAACPWTAATDVSWLKVSSGVSGSGNATLSVTFSDNYDAPRTGTVMVRWPTPTAGQNIHVAQAGCRYAVSKTAIDIGATGGPASFDVLQQSDPVECGSATQDRCVWTARSEVPWITITTSMPRSGDNSVSFTVAANDGATPRTGRIVVRDKVVTVAQAGK
jgi:hypothetical protein